MLYLYFYIYCALYFYILVFNISIGFILLHRGREGNVISIPCMSCPYHRIDNKVDFDFVMHMLMPLIKTRCQSWEHISLLVDAYVS